VLCEEKEEKNARAAALVVERISCVSVYYYLTLGARPGIFQHQFSLVGARSTGGLVALETFMSLQFKETAQELHLFLWSYPNRF